MGLLNLQIFIDTYQPIFISIKYLNKFPSSKANNKTNLRKLDQKKLN